MFGREGSLSPALSSFMVCRRNYTVPQRHQRKDVVESVHGYGPLLCCGLLPFHRHKLAGVGRPARQPSSAIAVRSAHRLLLPALRRALISAPLVVCVCGTCAPLCSSESLFRIPKLRGLTYSHGNASGPNESSYRKSTPSLPRCLAPLFPFDRTMTNKKQKTDGNAQNTSLSRMEETLD